MDDSRQKNFFLIGFLFIVIIFINVFIKSVDLSAKPTKSSSLETNNNSVIPNKEIERKYLIKKIPNLKNIKPLDMKDII